MQKRPKPKKIPKYVTPVPTTTNQAHSITIPATPAGQVATGQEFWVNFVLRRWEDMKLETTGPIRLPFPTSLTQPKDGSIGFFEVYPSVEAAVKDGADSRNLVKVVITRVPKVPK